MDGIEMIVSRSIASALLRQLDQESLEGFRCIDERVLAFATAGGGSRWLGLLRGQLFHGEEFALFGHLARNAVELRIGLRNLFGCRNPHWQISSSLPFHGRNFQFSQSNVTGTLWSS